VGAGVVGVEVAVIWANLVAAMAVARLGLSGLKKTLGFRKMVNKQINVRIISPTIIANKMVIRLPKFDIHSLLDKLQAASYSLQVVKLAACPCSLRRN
jgi:hypothetical protein